MNNAVYAATTGLLNRTRALDVTGSNLANASTTGYKRDRLITSSFGEYLTYRMDGSGDEIGKKTHGAMADEVHTNYEQGPLEATGRDQDFAILGEGFFTVQDPDGGERLTRDGSFQINYEGYLVTSTGAYVLGQNGRLEVGSGNLLIGESGEVSCDGSYIDTLSIVIPDDTRELDKQANGMLINPGEGGDFQGKIIQGHLERSNVDMMEEMATMMAASRAFQSCGQVIRILDSVNQKTVSEIGRI